MATAIRADSLKTYRARKHWTQEQLAEATKGPNKVSLPTIKRIESTKNDTYLANDRVAEALAKALSVKIGDPFSAAPARRGSGSVPPEVRLSAAAHDARC